MSTQSSRGRGIVRFTADVTSASVSMKSLQSSGAGSSQGDSSADASSVSGAASQDRSSNGQSSKGRSSNGHSSKGRSSKRLQRTSSQKKLQFADIPPSPMNNKAGSISGDDDNSSVAKAPLASVNSIKKFYTSGRQVKVDIIHTICSSFFHIFNVFF